MNQKIIVRKSIITALIVFYFVIFFQGCSTLENLMSIDSLTENQYSANNKQQQASREFVSKLRKHKESLDSIYMRACYFLERKKYKYALLEFETILEIDPSFVMAYNGMGISYDSLGLFTLAADYYKTALALNPNLNYVYNNLGYSYLLHNDLDSAIEAFKNAVALKQDDKKYHNNLGIAYARKGIYDQAFKEFTLAADEETALHNLAVFQNESKSPFQIIDGLAQIQSTVKSIDQKNEKMNLEPVSQKSVPYKLKSEIGVKDVKKILEIPPTQNQKISHKFQDQIQKKFFVQDATLKKLDMRIEDKEKLDRIGYRRSLEVVSSQYYPSQAGKVDSFKLKSNATISAKKMEADLGINDIVNSISTKEGSLDPKTKYTVKSDFSIVDTKMKNTMLQSSICPINIEIEVSNGNGVNHMARKTAQYLEENGYVVSRVTNAGHFRHEKTIIYYREGYLQEAYRVAQVIPGWNEMEKTEMHGKPSIKIRVLIGKDLVPFAKELDKNNDKEDS